MSQTKTTLLLAKYVIILASIGCATHSCGMKKNSSDIKEKLTPLKIPDRNGLNSDYSDSDFSETSQSPYDPETPTSPYDTVNFAKLAAWKKRIENLEPGQKTYFSETEKMRKRIEEARKQTP